MKRGNKSCVPLQEQKQAFVKYQQYFKLKDDLPSPCDKIFHEISKDLQCKMSAKALYISLKRNYDNFFDSESLHAVVSSDNSDSKSIVSKSVITEFASDSKEDSEGAIEDEDEVSRKHEVFTFFLDLYHWEKIQPITKYTVRNKFQSKSKTSQKKIVLPKHEWAHLLREEIWKKTKIPCSWTFQNHSVKYGDTVTCYGTCAQCKAGVKIRINWPTDKIIVCEGFLTDYDSSHHHIPAKKIKISPAKRRELSEILKNESAIVVRNRLADESMSVGDTEPSILPTAGCLRQIKYEYKRQYYHT